MAADNNYTADILARLGELFTPGMPWQRTLWSVGSAFALRELVESAQGADRGALSEKALKRHAQAVSRMVGEDPGVGGDGARKALQELLSRDLSAGGANYHEVALWADDIEAHGLERWRGAVELGDKPSREAFARALACELLRHGFSLERLRAWVSDLHKRVGKVRETDLVDEARLLISAASSEHQVLLLFLKPLRVLGETAPEVVDAKAAGDWLEREGFNRVRQHGGLDFPRFRRHLLT
jgi:hypothetical protein